MKTNYKSLSKKNQILGKWKNTLLTSTQQRKMKTSSDYVEGKRKNKGNFSSMTTVTGCYKF